MVSCHWQQAASGTVRRGLAVTSEASRPGLFRFALVRMFSQHCHSPGYAVVNLGELFP